MKSSPQALYAAAAAAGRGRLFAPGPSPEPGGTLVRDRLLRNMLSARSPRLILIHAAAGFGKTTLLQQFQALAQARNRDVIWLNLDAGDNDLHRFVAHLDVAFTAVGTRAAGQRPALPRKPGHERTGPALVDRIAMHGRSLMIVLDEFELIQSVPVLNYVQHLIEVFPDHITIAIASRTAPEIGLGRLRARGQLLEIDADALCFTLDEANTYIRQNRKLPLGDREITLLHQRTGGWAVGLYLASLSLQGRSDHGEFVSSFSGSYHEVAQYFAQDILARYDPPIREFLLRTSVLEQMCAPLCDAVTGREDGLQMLELLDARDGLVIRLGSGGIWFRYHSLLSSFLRDRLEVLYPGELSSLHRLAADWHFRLGRLVPAVEHLLKAGAQEDALEKMALCVPELKELGRVRLLVRWFSQIPLMALLRHPGLALSHAWALACNRRFDEAMRVMAAALEAMPPGQESGALKLEAQTIRFFILVMTDRVEECCAQAPAYLDQLSHQDSLQYCITAYSLCLAFVSACRYEEARAVLSRAMNYTRTAHAGLMYSVAVSIESIIDLINGRLGNALVRLRTLAERSGAPMRGEPVGGELSTKLPLAWAWYEQDELDRAERELADVLPYAKGNASNDMIIISHVLAARLAYFRGNHPQCQYLLAELEQLGYRDGTPRLMAGAWLERARMAVLEGQMAMASQALRTAELSAGPERRGIWLFANEVLDTPEIIRFRLRIAQGDLEGLNELILERIEDASAAQRFRHAVKLRILLALCLSAQARETEAAGVLNEVLRAAGDQGFTRVLLDEGAPFAALMKRWFALQSTQVATHGIAAHFITALLERLNIESPVPVPPSRREAKSAALDTESLTPREMEVLTLLTQGMRNKVLAKTLDVSEYTVKFHLRNIHAKLGAQGRTEAVAIARKRGLVS